MHMGCSQASHRPFNEFKPVLEMQECGPFSDRYHRTETGAVVSVNRRVSAVNTIESMATLLVRG